MVNEGDLWDDSALINAFDDAMSKYKMMHRKKGGKGCTKGGIVTEKGDQNASLVADESEVATGFEEASPSTNKAETDAKSPLLANDDPLDGSYKPESFVDPSTRAPLQDHRDASKGDTCVQSSEDYNQLLSHYYELEERRQKVLLQLQQFGNWNFQYSNDASALTTQGPSLSTWQEHLMLTNQACQLATVCSCCPYVCQCSMTSSMSFPASASVYRRTENSCVGNSTVGKLSSPSNDDIVKTAMGAAEKAISSLRERSSAESDITAEKKGRGEHGNEITSCSNSGTDLTVVLNAWYSAGFYTGKYLTEQSLRR